MTDNRKMLGQRIQEYRKRSGLTQEALAQLIQMEEKSLSRIERGIHYPSIETLEAIAKNVGVEMAVFFDDLNRKSVTELKKDMHQWIDALDDKQMLRAYRLLKFYAP